MTSSVRAVLVAAAAVIALMITEPAPGQSENHVPTVLIAFGTMYGVDGGFVGDANPIRGVVGDELPWRVESARGRLDVTGRLRIRVRGLVFTDDEEVPPELRGRNDEPDFRGLVSCLSEGESGGVTTANVVTQGFPATPFGDSDIDAQVTLPNPCVAPIVLVMSGSEDKWFAVNGFESESGESPGGDDGHDTRPPRVPHVPQGPSSTPPGFTSVPRR